MTYLLKITNDSNRRNGEYGTYKSVAAAVKDARESFRPHTDGNIAVCGVTKEGNLAWKADVK
jgi:hypothetical protein